MCYLNNDFKRFAMKGIPWLYFQAVYKSSEATYFDVGFHKFHFEYQLPDNIPSSFIGKFGSVTYILKATVHGERKGENSIATEPFLVARNYPLPDDTSEPHMTEEAKTYFGGCSWGKIKMNVQINKTGYVPGEDICLAAQVKNRSPVRVTAIQAALIMNSSYHAQKNKVMFKQIVNKKRDDYELEEGDDRTWQNVRIGVPPYIPESFLSCCDIIDLTYVFQFRVELMGGKELKIELPIIIGSNPRGLEVPENKKQDVNIHWTQGPRALHRQQIDEQHEMKDKWVIESPEFRNDTQVMNPLFEGNRGHMNNGDSKHGRQKMSPKSGDHREFDDIHTGTHTKM